MFQRGEDSRFVEVPIVQTTTSEDREMFSVTLTSDAHNIVVDPSNATVIIIEGLGMSLMTLNIWIHFQCMSNLFPTNQRCYSE